MTGSVQQRMYHPQLYPLQVNPATGELYLRLSSPLDNIILTSPRTSDAASIVSILNDPKVCRWLEGPPYPYLPSHAESWISMVKEESDVILRELEQANKDAPGEPLKRVRACPVRIIREVQEDGTDVFLGDICLRRCAFQYEELDEQRRLSEENASREVGDPNLVWCVGDYLASSHHGRGIMSAAFRTLMEAWAIPRMDVRHIRVEAFKGNVGSVRVFEKFGFRLEKTVERVEVNNTTHGSHILLWDLD
ncbi:uncharacterized protein LAESUDRAFT_730244 [Laetiporus sulphureus 93-53]|uniref:N-acetyltransferase domain-containing protein n=1 Tax=Laetiporus sulphureus 93-53 TaxID=1314785 RepID=A0A165CB96_9APHY|nr:uncharacterized protein LAESUDRAFT_730244 [Laetiporus sulphureus 93-53]KZT02496.1 hypothetical protein LAESUDRAFT_730244 [Laetiporus sulphureus 93-53]